MIDQSSAEQYEEFRNLFRDRLNSLQKDSWPCRVSDLRVYHEEMSRLFRYTYDKDRKLSDGMIKKAIDWDELSPAVRAVDVSGEITDKFVSDMEQAFNLAIEDLKVSKHLKDIPTKNQSAFLPFLRSKGTFTIKELAEKVYGVDEQTVRKSYLEPNGPLKYAEGTKRVTAKSVADHVGVSLEQK